jgi:hypothetical protein
MMASGVSCSRRVDSAQRWPDGSTTMPYRSPKNISVTGITHGRAREDRLAGQVVDVASLQHEQHRAAAGGQRRQRVQPPDLPR